MTEPILKLEGVTRQYERGRGRVLALDGLDLSVERGAFLGIVGRSGSGKTTLLNLIGGLDRPTTGRITVDGLDLSNLDDDELAAYRRDRLGFVFQRFHLLPTLTAIENVSLPLSLRGLGRREQTDRAREALEAVGLGERTDHMPGELSGGESQRVAIARAIVVEPTLLLADEPTGNLDSKTAEEILGRLESLNRDREVTVCMVTHEREIANQYAERVIELLDGAIVADTESERESA